MTQNLDEQRVISPVTYRIFHLFTFHTCTHTMYIAFPWASSATSLCVRIHSFGNCLLHIYSELLSIWWYLSHCGYRISSVLRLEGVFLAHLEVKIDRFVSEGWKFITETEFIFSRFICRPTVSIKLLLLLVVKSGTWRRDKADVNIIITTLDHLINTKKRYPLIKENNGEFNQKQK